jgi:hypothetical protein
MEQINNDWYNLDPDIPHETRINSLIKQPDILSCIIRLIQMYNKIPVASTRSYLVEISRLNLFSLDVRVFIISRLAFNMESVDNFFLIDHKLTSDIYDIFYDLISKDVTEYQVHTTYLDLVLIGLKSKQNMEKYLIKFLEYSSVSELIRYKFVNNLRNSFHPAYLFCCRYIIYSDFYYTFILLSIKGISSSFSTKQLKQIISYIEYITDNLISCNLPNSDELTPEEKVTGDLLDTIILLVKDKPEFKKNIINAEANLFILGGNTTDVLKNKQNVHDSGIQNSVNNSLKQLIKISGELKTDTQHRWEQSTSRLLGIASSIPGTKPIGTDGPVIPSVEQKLIESFDRIYLDQTLCNGLLLIDIFLMIYDMSLKFDCIGRLIDELIDGAGLCTSGFVARLLNVLSGIVPGIWIQIDLQAGINQYTKHLLQKLITEAGDPRVMDEFLGIADVNTSQPVAKRKVKFATMGSILNGSNDISVKKSNSKIKLNNFIFSKTEYIVQSVRTKYLADTDSGNSLDFHQIVRNCMAEYLR